MTSSPKLKPTSHNHLRSCAYLNSKFPLSRPVPTVAIAINTVVCNGVSPGFRASRSSSEKLGREGSRVCGGLETGGCANVVSVRTVRIMKRVEKKEECILIAV